MKTFAEKALAYNLNLTYKIDLPDGFQILNPFKEDPKVQQIMTLFYQKFYGDHHKRKLMLGINPGRFGAGVTGVPFTDTRHLTENCDIPYNGKLMSEPSSNFVYTMIDVYGGVKSFYKDVYIHSIFPLALIRKNAKGNFINCNYYDDPRLVELLTPFMIEHLKLQLEMGVSSDVVYILGKKNGQFFNKITKDLNLFKQIEIFEHPRFIQQYRYKSRMDYAQRFVQILKK